MPVVNIVGSAAVGKSVLVRRLKKAFPDIAVTGIVAVDKSEYDILSLSLGFEQEQLARLEQAHLLTEFERALPIVKGEVGSIVIERGIFSTVLHAEAAHRIGLIKELDYKLVARNAEILLSSHHLLNSPHCIVHLHCPPDISKKRISKRPKAKHLDCYQSLEYLQALYEIHQEWIKEFCHPLTPLQIYSFDTSTEPFNNPDEICHVLRCLFKK